MEEKTVKTTQYPNQIASYLNNRQTLAIDQHLAVSNGTSDSRRKPVPPLETPGYSVFRVTLLEGQDEKNILMANIPEDDVFEIYENAKEARRMKAKEGALPTVGGGTESDVRLTMGTYKGKTPAEVLSMPDGRKKLEQTRDFLMKNVAKYPRNQVQIDAINKALSEPVPKAKAETATAEPATFQIYASEIKPLKSVPAETEGHTFCYQITMTKNLLMKYPYEIKILNCEMPMKKAANGLELPEYSKAVNKRTAKIVIPEKDFFKIISKMKEFKTAFRYVSMPAQIKLANKITFDNIQKSKSDKEP